jgi:integrase
MHTSERGDGRVFQRGEVWWIQYYFDGQDRRESSRSTNKKVAERLLRQRLAKKDSGELQEAHFKQIRFADLTRIIEQDYQLNKRKSVDRLRTALKALEGTFGGTLARSITLDRLTAYANEQLAAGHAPATVRYELAVLRRAFRLAHRAGKAIVPPFPALHVSNTRTGFFERKDFEAVRAQLPVDLQRVVTFAYQTGWRTRSEALSLQWKQVDFHAGVVRLEPGTTKNDDGRMFPFAALPELNQLLRQQWEETKALQVDTGQIIPFVFHRQGKRIKDFRKAWRDACKRAGVPDRLVHDFRRTAVRNLERAGVPRSVAMKLTGHKTESVYRRYAIVCEADLSEGLKKLAVLHEAEQRTPHYGTVSGTVAHLPKQLALSGAS